MRLFDNAAANALQAKGIDIQTSVSARKLTTFGSGGMVDYVILPSSREQLLDCYRFLEGYEYHLLGAGSNTLISDNGITAALSTTRCKGFEISGCRLWAAAGEYLPALGKAAAEKGLSGLEFACGIPATVGGAVAMNSGAFGKEMRDVLASLEYYKNGEVGTVTPRELGMSYRNGRLMGRRVLSACFNLVPASSEEISERMRDYHSYRFATQPHEPSAGSVFRRVNGQSPAIYIQGCGMKGARLGFATVSGKHCNFIINSGGAETRDFFRLADLIKDKVRERYGIELETEVVLIRDSGNVGCGG